MRSFALVAHHQVAVALAQADHRRGGDGVEDQFGGGAGLQASGACEDFRAGFDRDDHVGLREVLGAGVAGEEDAPRSETPGVVEATSDERGQAAGGDADEDVGRAEPAPLKFGDGFPGVVFGAFDRADERPVAAGDDALDLVGVGAEGRWALGGVEHPEAPAGARADVEEPAACPECLDDEFYGPGNLFPGGADSGGDLPVLIVHQVHDLER